MENLPKRLEDALTKLYNAFHGGTLNAFDCKACAIGSLVGHDNWFMHMTEGIGQGELPYKERFFGMYKPPIHPDYSEQELFEIERVFLTEWSHAKSMDGRDKEIQFKGLCAIVEYLCKLDGVENVMDYTSLFEFDSENNAVKELQL